MKLSTAGRTGEINKNIWVETNDPVNPKFTLKMIGKVNELVILTPSKTNLTQALLLGTVGEKISKVVTLIQDDKEPMLILSATTLNDDNFRYSMEEIQIDGKKAYQFIIENISTTPGRYLDKIFLYTDSMVRNPLIIMINGDIRAAKPDNEEGGKPMS